MFIVNNGETIISWLDSIKNYNSIDGYIPGLLSNAKIKINTETNNGNYNLILLWIKNTKYK